MCLYCNELCRPFSSLEAVRKHMEAKSHCKLHYGDGDDDEDAELEEFYDYSSRFQLASNPVVVFVLTSIPLFMPKLNASSFGIYIYQTAMLMKRETR